MIETDELKVGGLLLAAGGSTRFGGPKQLAEFDGATLILRAAAALAGSACDVKVVVLGHEADACKAEIGDLELDLRINSDWQDGISSSLKFGLEQALLIQPDLNAIVVTLADQPYISAEIINSLIAEYRRIRPSVVASEYNGISGVPALFSNEMFSHIMLLSGDKGAQGIIRSARGRVAHLPVPEAAHDIDSPDDITLDRGDES